MKKAIAVYPGFFDPITNGHLSIVSRGLEIFDKIDYCHFEQPQEGPLVFHR